MIGRGIFSHRAQVILLKTSGNLKPCRREVLRDGRLTWLYHALRLALALIFIYAGTVKLLDPKAFARAIAQYDLVPEVLLPLIAIGLPSLEVVAGLGLIMEVRGSLATISALLLMFLVILGYALRQNLDIDCGCFTVSELKAQHSVATAFWRDLLMIGGTVFLGWRRRSRAPQNLWIRKLILLIKGETTP
jgi:uncharacterized membrane protein YphA (DoxX/SURF4 family)